MKAMDSNGKAKKCKGMEGLIEEGEEVIKQKGEDSVLDAALIGAAQKVEHYEIASYGTLCAYAQMLGETEAETLLQQSLTEERETDERLTEMAERSINLDAAS